MIFVPNFKGTVLACCDKPAVEKCSSAYRVEMGAKGGPMVPCLSFNNDYGVIAANVGLIEDEGLFF